LFAAILKEGFPMLRRCALAAAALALAVCGSTYAQTHSSTPAKPRIDAFGDTLPDGAIARLGTMRYMHSGKQLLGFSADSKSLLFHDNAAMRWMDAATGKITKVARYQDPPALVLRKSLQTSYAMLSANGKVLVYAQEKSGALGIVDATTGKELRSVKATDVFHAQTVVARADNTQMSADGKMVVMVPPELYSPQGRIHNPLAWADLSLGKCLYAVHPPKDAYWLTAQVSPDGKQVVAMPNQKPLLHFFDTATGKEIRALSFDHSKLTSFALRGDGKTLLGWNFNNSSVVRLYDLTDAKELKEIRAFQPISPHSMVLSRDGKHLFVPSGNKIAQWDVDAGKNIRTFEAGLDGAADLSQLALPPNNKLLAVRSSQAVVVYDLAGDKPLTPPTAGCPVALGQFGPDGRTLVTGNTRYGNWLWDVQQVKPLRMLARLPNHLHESIRRDSFLIFGGDVWRSLFP
jgi:DNA-binding beta-propeller fold protein YncE